MAARVCAFFEAVAGAQRRCLARGRARNGGQLRVAARIRATAIMGAVSARRTRGPRPSGVKLASWASSPGARPPSGHSALEILIETRRTDTAREYRLHHDSIRAYITEAVGTAAVRPITTRWRTRSRPGPHRQIRSRGDTRCTTRSCTGPRQARGPTRGRSPPTWRSSRRGVATSAYTAPRLMWRGQPSAAVRAATRRTASGSPTW